MFTNQIRAELTAQQRRLRHLEVVEQAESLVRDHHSHLLLVELDQVLGELDTARDRLGLLRAQGDQMAVVVAEEGLYAIQRQADTLLRALAKHLDAAEGAAGLYTKKRAQLKGNITGLRLALGKRTPDYDRDGTLRFPI